MIKGIVLLFLSSHNASIQELSANAANIYNESTLSGVRKLIEGDEIINALDDCAAVLDIKGSVDDLYLIHDIERNSVINQQKTNMSGELHEYTNKMNLNNSDIDSHQNISEFSHNSGINHCGTTSNSTSENKTKETLTETNLINDVGICKITRYNKSQLENSTDGRTLTKNNDMHPEHQRDELLTIDNNINIQITQNDSYNEIIDNTTSANIASTSKSMCSNRKRSNPTIPEQIYNAGHKNKRVKLSTAISQETSNMVFYGNKIMFEKANDLKDTLDHISTYLSKRLFDIQQKQEAISLFNQILQKVYKSYIALTKNKDEKVDTLLDNVKPFCFAYCNCSIKAKHLKHDTEFNKFNTDLCARLEDYINRMENEINNTPVYELDNILYQKLTTPYKSRTIKFDEIQQRWYAKGITTAICNRKRYSQNTDESINVIKTVILSKLKSIKDETVQVTIMLLYSFIIQNFTIKDLIYGRLLRLNYFIDHYYDENKGDIKYTGVDLQNFYINKLTWYLFSASENTPFKQGEFNVMHYLIAALDHSVLVEKNSKDNIKLLWCYGYLIPFYIHGYTINPLKEIYNLGCAYNEVKDCISEILYMPIALSKLFVNLLKKKQ